jgi:hypothetical protein
MGVTVFRTAFLVTYASLALLIFCGIVKMLALSISGDIMAPKILLKGIGATAGLIGVVHPLIRRAILGKGALTQFGRWIARMFDAAPDTIADGISFPWQLTLFAGLVIFLADFVLHLGER